MQAFLSSHVMGVNTHAPSAHLSASQNQIILIIQINRKNGWDTCAPVVVITFDGSGPTVTIYITSIKGARIKVIARNINVDASFSGAASILLVQKEK